MRLNKQNRCPLKVNAGKNAQICYGQSTKLDATAEGGLPPYLYKWTPTASLDKTDTSAPVAKPGVTTAYVVTVADQSGNISKDTVVVTIINCPALTVDAGANQAVCQGTDVILGDVSPVKSGMPPYTYHWTPEAGLDQTDQPRPRLTALDNRTYYLTVTDSINRVVTDSLRIIVYPKPEKPVITQRENYLVSSMAGYYQWYLNDVPLPGGTNQEIRFSASGTYKVKALNNFNCFTFSDPFNIVYTDVQYIQQGKVTYNVFPNPFNATAYLQLTLSTSAQVGAELKDFTGKSLGVLLDKRLLTPGTTHLLPLQLNKFILSQGVYILEIHIGKEVMRKMLVK